MPEGAVKVDRSTRWGNPFRVGEDGAAEECVQLYRTLLGGRRSATSRASLEAQTAARAYVGAHLHELRGKDLACWCRPGDPCHADVLLEFANG
jgi:hypothetical protein